MSCILLPLVSAWLREVLGSEQVPHYEVRESTIDLLWQLMMVNKRRDKYAELLAQDYHQRTTEYKADCERVNSILSQLGLSPAYLSQSGVICLSSLLSLATTLQLSDTSTSSFLLALSDHRQRALRMKNNLFVEKASCTKLEKAAQAVQNHHKTLKLALENMQTQRGLEAPDLKKKERQLSFLQSKSEEYKRQITALQAKPSIANFDSSTTHAALDVQNKELKVLKEELETLKKKLDTFQNLPPDISLAKVAIEEAKRELASLEQELAGYIDLMHT